MEDKDEPQGTPTVPVMLVQPPPPPDDEEEEHDSSFQSDEGSDAVSFQSDDEDGGAVMETPRHFRGADFVHYADSVHLDFIAEESEAGPEAARGH